MCRVRAFFYHSRYEIGADDSHRALKSPHILELSGIGRKDVLDSIGVQMKIHLPGVGENVQEQIVAGVTWELPGGPDKLRIRPSSSFYSYPLTNERFQRDKEDHGITAMSYTPLQCSTLR